MKRVFVVVLNWNGWEDTKGCLASLEQSTGEFECVVVDNGSSDGSEEKIRAGFPWARVVQTGENLGYAGGNNEGIMWALREGAEYVLILNNDTEVAPGMVSALKGHLESHPEVGIVGGCPYRFDERRELDHLGGVWNRKTGQFELVREAGKLDYVCGCSMMVRREVFERVGLFDERFFLFWEEADLCARARRASYLVEACQKGVLYHKISASFTGKKRQKNYYWWRNRLLWIEKNCLWKERRSLYFHVIIPNLLHQWFMQQLKRCQILLSQNNKAERKEKIDNYQAVLVGSRDYLLRRFGKGPDWIFKKK